MFLPLIHTHHVKIRTDTIPKSSRVYYIDVRKGVGFQNDFGVFDYYGKDKYTLAMPA